METVVGCRFLCPAAPLVVGLHNILLRVGDDEVYDHGGAANQARRGAAEKILGSNSSHERQFHVRVRIYSTGHDVAAARVNDLCPAGFAQVLADCADLSVFAQYISPMRLLGSDERSPFYQYGHINLLQRFYNQTCTKNTIKRIITNGILK